jgi:hypothetical protein
MDAIAGVELLRAALSEIPGLMAQTVADVDPPAVVVGPPALEWEDYTSEPSTGRYPVWLVVTGGDGATEALLGLVPLVAAAIDAIDTAALVRADPGVYPSSTGSDLPAYQFQVEIALGG